MKKLRLAILVFVLSMAFNAGAEESSTNAEPQWTVPPQWREITPGPAMIKAYSPMPDSKQIIVVTVNRLGPGSPIHRERPPLLLPSFEMTGDSRPPVRTTLTLAHSKDRATMLDMEGMDSQTRASRRQIVIKVLRPEANEEWLYKIIGDAKAVASQKEAFIKFVQSARYH